MPFHTHRLPTGLQLIGETIPSSRSVAVGFYVRTGSRDETAAESGVSHYLEHMMFKGTAHRSALDVNRDFDRIGANYNASTSAEVTNYYASVLPEYLPQAVDILADILRPSLRQDDFDTEKNVILEEIKMSQDEPPSEAWDNARRIYYGSHNLGQSILGTTESVTALTAEQMRAYFDRRYVPSNILVAVAGPIDWEAFVKLIDEKCGRWADALAVRTGLTEHIGPGGIHAVTKEGLAQENVLCIAASPPAESMLRYTAGTLATAIGDDSGSRLHWSLVDPGKVESASCWLYPCQGNGLIAASYSCDPADATENLGIVQQVLSEVQRDGIPEEELAQAKNKIASRVVRAAERPMGRMRTIASSWMYNNEYSDPDVELARFDAVDRKCIREYLDQYPVDRLTVVGYGPATTLG